MAQRVPPALLEIWVILVLREIQVPQELLEI
jgi:hypothetical protein